MKAQYGILRFKKYKGPAISPIEAHNERTKEQYASNPEDEKERTGISKYAGRKSLIEEPVKGRLFCMKKATETKSVAFVISFFLCAVRRTKAYQTLLWL